MRFGKYIAVRPSTAMVAIIVEIMVQVISILGIATKEIKEGFISRSFLADIYPNLTFHAEKFFKRLFGINRLKDALQQLDKLAPEEALMAGADTQVIAAHIDENVTDVAANVVVIDEGVKDIRVGMEGVHGQVTEINTGEIFSSLLPPCACSASHLGLKEVFKHVSDLSRS